LKSSKITAAILCCFTLAFAATASAQQQTNGGYVTVLDVAKVFKNYAPFTTKLKQIEQEAEGLRTSIQAQQQKLTADAQQIVSTYKAGTPERKNAETQLEQQRVTMMTDSRHKQEDLLNREAKLYHDTYNEMKTVVAAFCQRAKIAIVIRYESDLINGENRTEVIKGVNRNIVYQDRTDITEAIIGQMLQTAGLPMPKQLK